MGFRDRKRPDLKISEESAEEVLSIFLDFYDIYPDNYVTQGERNIYESYCSKLITAIRRGKLEIEKDDATIKVIQHTKGGNRLEYKEMTNEAKLVDTGARDAEEKETMLSAASRRYTAVMGHLSGMGYDVIKKLKAEDTAIMEALAFLLLNL